MSLEPMEASSLQATLSAADQPGPQPRIRRFARTRRIGTYRLFRYFAAPGPYVLRLTGTTLTGETFAVQVPLAVERP